MLLFARTNKGVSMFDFLKRKTASKLKATVSPVMVVKPSEQVLERRSVRRPLPVPEVVEGNNPSDWALWEEIVQMQESQQQVKLRSPPGVTTNEVSPDDDRAMQAVLASLSKKGA